MFPRSITFLFKLLAAAVFSAAVAWLTGWVVQYLYADVTEFGLWLAYGLGFSLCMVTCLTGGGVGRQPWDRQSMWDEINQEARRRAKARPAPLPAPEVMVAATEPPPLAWPAEPVADQPTLPLEPAPVVAPAAPEVQVAGQGPTPMEWLDFLNQVADRSDELLMQRFRRAAPEATEKADGTPVSEVDQVVERAIRAAFLDRYPTVGCWTEAGEETLPEPAIRLILAPVDGSQNFSRGIPFFATLLAIEQDGRVVAGLVSAPALFTRWSAGRGLGAFRGRSRMRVSAVSDLAQASLFYGDLAPASAAGKHWPILPLMQRVKRARGFGDFYQHVLVAEGAGEIAIDTEIRPWAVAPFMVILEEAGGMVSSLRGEDSFEAGSFVSSNGLLHDKALAILTASASQEKVRQTE